MAKTECLIKLDTARIKYDQVENAEEIGCFYKNENALIINCLIEYKNSKLKN